jgi:hypothetical protein
MNKITSSTNYENNIPLEKIVKNNPLLIDVMPYDINPISEILYSTTIDYMSSEISPSSSTNSNLNSDSIPYSKYLSTLSPSPTYALGWSNLDIRYGNWNNVGNGILGPRRDDGIFELNAAYAVSRVVEWNLLNSEKLSNPYHPLTGEYSYLSPAFIYVNRPTPILTISDACDVLANIGICSEESYPMSILKIRDHTKVLPSTITENVIIEAQKNKLRITNKVIFNTVDELHSSFYLNGPFIGVFDGYLTSTGNIIPSVVLRSSKDTRFTTNPIYLGKCIFPAIGYFSTNKTFILETCSFYHYTNNINSDNSKINPELNDPLYNRDDARFNNKKNVVSGYVSVPFEALTSNGGEIWTTINLP